MCKTKDSLQFILLQSDNLEVVNHSCCFFFHNVAGRFFLIDSFLTMLLCLVKFQYINAGKTRYLTTKFGFDNVSFVHLFCFLNCNLLYTTGLCFMFDSESYSLKHLHLKSSWFPQHGTAHTAGDTFAVLPALECKWTYFCQCLRCEGGTCSSRKGQGRWWNWAEEKVRPMGDPFLRLPCLY